MCKYCEEEKKIEENRADNIFFTIYGRFLMLEEKVLSIPFARTVPINYCPMCGRKLKEGD